MPDGEALEPDGEALEDLNLPVVVAEGGHGKEGDSPVASGDMPGELGGGAEPSKKARDKKSTQSVESVTKCEPKAFILSEGLPPVPAKLVGHILRGDFIDMSELLRDNLEAERCGVLPNSADSASASSRHTRREVPDLLSWAQCLSLYTAVVASKHPDRVLKLLAIRPSYYRRPGGVEGGDS